MSPDHWKVLFFHANYGNCLRALGRLDEAEEELLYSYESLKDRLGKRHADVRYVAGLLATLYGQTGDLEKAAQLRRH